MTDNNSYSVDKLNSILDEFDSQIELDLMDIERMGISEDDYESEEDASAADEPASEEDAAAEESAADEASVVDEPVAEDDPPAADDNPIDKNWLFEENIRLMEVERRLEDERARLDKYSAELDAKAREVEEMSARFNNERQQFRNEMNTLTTQVTRERQRLKQEEQFFDKKMDILKAGFADLDRAKREFEAEKLRYEARETYYVDDDIPGYGTSIARTLFVGITNPLMLKKRYKDLVKIFHPDNLAGDHELFRAITIEYERLQGKIGSEGIG